MTKPLRALNILAALVVIAIGVREFIVPPVAARMWAADYQDLMFKCDQVMREHFIAKKEVELNPSEQAIKALGATELGLLDCHQYDKLRKKLEAFGVTDSELSAIGLAALEEKRYELRKFVEIHEIRY